MPSPPAVNVFRNVNVVTLDAPGVVSRGTVMTSGGRIVSIAPADTPGPAGANVIEANGAYLMPGLIDAHIHLYQEADNEVTSYLRYGITTALSLGTPEPLDALLRTRKRIESGELAGPRIYATGPTVGGYRAMGSVPDVEPFLDQLRISGLEFVKVYNDVSRPVFDALVTGARRRGLAVFGHLPRSFPPEYALANGLDVLAHLEELFFTAFDGPGDEDLGRLSPSWRADGTRIPAILDLMKRHDVVVIPNLGATASFQNLWLDEERELSLDDARYLTPNVVAQWRRRNYSRRDLIGPRMVREHAKYDLIRRLTFEAHQRGLLLLAGSDAPVPAQYPGRSLHQELRLLVAAGLSNEAALRTATVNGGTAVRRFIDRDVCIGVVRVGCEADLVLVAANPLENIRNTQAIVGVMSDGRWYTTAALAELARSTLPTAGPVRPVR